MRARGVYRLASINMDCYINRKRYSSINEEVKCLFLRENTSHERQDRPTAATWWLEDSAVNHISYRLFKIGHGRLLSNSSHWLFIQLKVWIIILLQLTNLSNSTTTDQSVQFYYNWPICPILRVLQLTNLSNSTTTDQSVQFYYNWPICPILLQLTNLSNSTTNYQSVQFYEYYNLPICPILFRNVTVYCHCKVKRQ